MKMSKSDQKKYPKLAEYVRNQVPKLKDAPLIMKNLKRFGSLPRAEAIAALSWGHAPLIIMKDLKTNQCAGHLDTYGCFRPAASGQIELARRLAQQFEKNARVGKDNKNKKGNMVYVVGATLLHELCHWGNQKHNVAETTEQVLEFEKATYGKTIW